MDEQAKVIARIREELAARERETAAREAEAHALQEQRCAVQRDKAICEMRGVCERILGKEMLDALGAEITTGGIKLVYRGRETFWQITERQAGEPGYRETVEACIVKFCDETDVLCAQGDALIARFQAAQTVEEFQAVAGETPWDMEDYVEMVQQAAWERVKQAVAERERQRAALEKEAFFPFVFYRVHYGLPVLCEDGENVVEMASFDSLDSKPLLLPASFGSQSWWEPLGRRPRVCVPHIFTIERILVSSVSELPHWCPTQETEFGVISFPPDQAHRI